jgi:hypothetical protein
MLLIFICLSSACLKFFQLVFLYEVNDFVIFFRGMSSMLNLTGSWSHFIAVMVVALV